MSKTKTVFLIGVLGGFVGYACGVAFTPTRAAAQQLGPADAGAGEPPVGGSVPAVSPAPTSAPRPTCLQWEVKELAQMVFGSTVITVDEGWEPFAYHDGVNTVVLRRCVR